MRAPFHILSFLLVSVILKAGQPGIIFKENKGQWPEKVLFGTEIFNTKFYVNKNSFNYCLYSNSDLGKLHNYTHHKNEEQKESRVVRGHNYEVEFIGADLSSVTKTKEQAEYYNYFLGNNKSKWANSIKAYGNLLFNEIYEGVDLKLYSNGANLKYDFIVKPNANINSLKLNYKYIDGIELVSNELIIKTSVGNVIEKEPIAYQIINGKQKQVKCKYLLLSDNTVGFVFPEGYNKNYELVIDPVVVVCSYSNAFMHSDGSACTYDASGNIYVFAYADLSYPTTPGVFQVNYNAYYDYALSVYNTNGSSKMFSTYLGGDSLDFPLTAIVKNNEITLFGQTLSKDFPYTNTAFDTTYNGGHDFVISKLNMSGTSLLASTYVGGGGDDGYNGFTSGPADYTNLGEMICDTSGNAYIVSSTTSTNFPVSSSAISSSKKGISDACVLKIDKTLSNLVWSTYLGGNRDESGRSLRTDGNGGVYLIGITTSSNFPVTSGAIQSTKNGALVIGDMFISHINTTGSALIASTYLGTTGFDYARHMDLDVNNDVYIYGQISVPSQLVPTPGIYSNPNGYNSIHKVNSSLNSVIYQTRFGNYISSPSGISPYLYSTGFKVDSCQNIYIAGYGANTFFTTPNAFQPTYGGSETDLYFAVFSTNCSSLKFASYFGGLNPKWNFPINYGEHSDGGTSHFDGKGYLYQSICINGGLPTTAGAFTPTKISDTLHWNDAFVKIDFQTFINAGSSYGANITGCPPFTPTFVSTTNTGTSYWNLGNGITSNSNTASTTYTSLGNYNVLLVVTDTSTCNKYDSIKSVLSVINPTEFDLGEDIPACFDSKTLLKANVSAITYSWSTGQTNPNIYVNQLGSYTLTINNGGCNSSDVVNVVLGEKKLSERFPNVVTPNGDNINDYIDFIKYNFEEVEFYVFDRWGRERYKITKPDEKWSPVDLNNGTYYYVVNYKSSCTGKFATDKGYISVFK